MINPEHGANGSGGFEATGMPHSSEAQEEIAKFKEITGYGFPESSIAGVWVLLGEQARVAADYAGLIGLGGADSADKSGLEGGAGQLGEGRRRVAPSRVPSPSLRGYLNDQDTRPLPLPSKRLDGVRINDGSDHRREHADIDPRDVYADYMSRPPRRFFRFLARFCLG